MANESEPAVKIEYANLNQEDSLLAVDGRGLGEALACVGYPPSLRKPLVLSGKSISGEIISFFL